MRVDKARKYENSLFIWRPEHSGGHTKQFSRNKSFINVLKIKRARNRLAEGDKKIMQQDIGYPSVSLT